jgi:glycosyltransferase involved in cell wall biosynthesis
LRAPGLPADRLVAHGPLPHAQAIECLRGWDAGVAPYLPLDDFYFSPLKVLEYMAAGLCTVASALGEIPRLLGEGDRGVLVPAGNAGRLTAALVELARTRRAADELGRRARRHVLEAHTWERNARVVVDTLRGRRGELAA